MYVYKSSIYPMLGYNNTPTRTIQTLETSIERKLYPGNWIKNKIIMKFIDESIQ